MALVAVVAVSSLLLTAISWWWSRGQPLSDTVMWKDRRQSHRVALITPVSVYGWQADEPFFESAETLDVSRSGGLIRLSGTVTPSQEVILTNLQTDEDLLCRVARIAQTNDGSILVGLHFPQASPTFWQIGFVPVCVNDGTPPSPGKSFRKAYSQLL
jgi:hypothetical protein